MKPYDIGTRKPSHEKDSNNSSRRLILDGGCVKLESREWQMKSSKTSDGIRRIVCSNKNGETDSIPQAIKHCANNGPRLLP
jgi:hypothetical protein